MDEIDDFKKTLESIREKIINDEPFTDELNNFFNNYNTDEGKINVVVKKLEENSILPNYNYGGDSGFDLFSTIDIEIESFERALIPTGLSFSIPDNTEIQIRSKSGLALKEGIFVLNSPGTIDSSYNGEIKVILFNTSKNTFLVKKNMKIAQAVICPVFCGSSISFVESNNLKNTERGNKGFGSTGI